MTLRNKILYGGALLTAGQALSQCLSVVRNILVAKLLVTEEDFGIASLLITSLGLYEMITNIGVSTFVVQDRDGDQQHFQNVIHLVSLIRGMASAVLLLVFAYPLALIFGIPQATWAFASLAAIPVLRGLTHLDILRLQREHLFMPTVLQELVGQLVSVTICIPFLKIFRDYSAVLYILILQTAVMTAMSHILAKRQYRWARDLEIERRIMRFGIPLLFNGVLYFFISQGDRIALGSAGQLFSTAHYTMKDMAAYSAAYLIASLAPQFLTRILTSLFMPLLSSSDDSSFVVNTGACIEGFAFIGSMVAVPMVILSDLLVSLLYGGRYSSAGICTVFLVISQTIFVIRSGANIPMLARARTWEVLINSAWRCSAFLGTFALAVAGLPVHFIIIPSIIGELLGLVLLAKESSTRFNVPTACTARPLCYTLLGLIVSAAFRIGCFDSLPVTAYVVAGIGIWVGFIAVWLTRFPATNAYLHAIFAHSLVKLKGAEPT